MDIRERLTYGLFKKEISKYTLGKVTVYSTVVNRLSHYVKNFLTYTSQRV